MLKTHRIIPLVFILFLFGLTLIPAPIVIAQQADDVVVECRPVTKTEEREVCQEQPITKTGERQRCQEQPITKTGERQRCQEQPITKTKEREVCQQQPKTEWNEQRRQMITKMQTVCTKQPYNVTDQECTKEIRRHKIAQPVAPIIK